MKHKRTEAETLESLHSQPLPEVRSHSVDRLLSKPQYSALAYEVCRRRGHQTLFYHVAAWPQTHWWDLQNWINQAQWDLEQLFGPVVRLAATQKQVHAGKVHLLAFFEIGPIHPFESPLMIGSAWRTFLAEPKHPL